jgi:Rha family phage regulatory protein
LGWDFSARNFAHTPHVSAVRAALDGWLFRGEQPADEPKLPVVRSRADDTVIADSRDVAEAFGKQHGHVLRSIQGLDCPPEFARSNFGASTYTDPSGRTLPCYEMTRDGFSFLVMGFTGPKAARWKELYITAFNSMEPELRRRDDEVIHKALRMCSPQATRSANMVPMVPALVDCLPPPHRGKPSRAV